MKFFQSNIQLETQHKATIEKEVIELVSASHTIIGNLAKTANVLTKTVAQNVNADPKYVANYQTISDNMATASKQMQVLSDALVGLSEELREGIAVKKG